MQAAYVRHDGAADHDVMEMGDDEIGVVDVHVDAEGGNAARPILAERKKNGFPTEIAQICKSREIAGYPYRVILRDCDIASYSNG